MEFTEETSTLKEKNLPIKFSTQIEQDLPTNIDSDTFLDYFGKFSPINTNVVNRFRIKKVSLIQYGLWDSW